MLKRNRIVAAVIAVVVVCAAAGVGFYKINNSKVNESSVNSQSIASENNNTQNSKAADDKDSSSTDKQKSAVTADNDSSFNANKGSSSKKSVQGTKSETKKSKAAVTSSNSKKSKSAGISRSAKSPKSRHLARLAQIEEQDKKCGLSSAATTADMREAQGKRYKLWDDELNSIYSSLKKQLPKNKMAALQKEEASWIKQKEANSKKAGQKYEGGTMQPVEEAGSLVNDTKERCYYLVKNYM